MVVVHHWRGGGAQGLAGLLLRLLGGQGLGRGRVFPLGWGHVGVAVWLGLLLLKGRGGVVGAHDGSEPLLLVPVLKVGAGSVAGRALNLTGDASSLRLGIPGNKKKVSAFQTLELIQS